MNQVTLSTRGARRIRQGHLWAYRSELRDAGVATGGEIVQVVDEARNFVGRAFFSDASQIAVRILSTREEAINRDWWRARFLECASRRAAMMQKTNAYRLVYSEGDLLPSIIVDVYAGHYVLQTLSQGAARVQDDLVRLIVELFQPLSVIERNDSRVREIENLDLRTGSLYGDCPEEIEITQHGIKFLVAPLSGQKTGAFLDQRENYLAAREAAHGRALDCFTFNGGFALHLAAQCEKIIGVDISAAAIAAAERNAGLNKITNVEFRTANVFDLLREKEAAGERFDSIILDPPAFTKSRATIESGARGYKEINLRALKLLNRGGVLVTCTCSYHVSEQLFLEILTEAALDARRRLQIVEKRGQSADHPVLLGVPETQYLKCIIARIIE